MSEESPSVRLFARALEVPGPERDAFLRAECPDESVRAEIASLLAHHDAAAPEFLEQGPGAMIGPYRIERTLGEGGFGVVYLAEQERPIRRRVALKVIKAGMDTSSVVARFALERQALAVMEHPGIARVYDAGATPRGRPYFAMEYVEGKPITAYAREKALPVKARLELFIPVCDAIQHAHQKGIIHRDLKPSNILVTESDAGEGGAVAKVIDFGIAKATDHRHRGLTMETQQGMVLATPEYASPEQVDPALGGGDIDTRTDIYSLGAVLYELLTGEPPLDREAVRAATLSELQRRIREEAPPKPSTRVLARDPATSKHLRGDLDWIVARAMEKDRDRRYASAAELGADLRRHLRREPVLAGPPSTIYRVRRFASRYRGPLLAAGAVFAALVIGLALAIAGMVEARRRTREAEDQLETSQAVLTFVNGDMLGSIDPSLARGRDVTVREVLANASERVGKLAGKPLVEAATRLTIARLQMRLGRNDQALPHLVRAVEIRKERLGTGHQQTLDAERWLAVVHDDDGRLKEAAALFELVLEESRRSLGPEHPDTLRAMADVALLRERQGSKAQSDEAPEGPERKRLWDEAESLETRVLEARRRVLGETHPDTLLSMNNFAYLLRRRGRFDEAAPLAEAAMKAATSANGEDDRLTMLYVNTLALVREGQERYADAEGLHLKNLANRRRVLTEKHPDTLATMLNLARLYRKQGRRDEGIPLAQGALEGWTELYGAASSQAQKAQAELELLMRLQPQR